MTSLFTRTAGELADRVAASGSMPGAIVSERRYRRILFVTATGTLVGFVLAVLPGRPLAGLTAAPASLYGAAVMACTVTAILLQLRVWVLGDRRAQWFADTFVLTSAALWLSMHARGDAGVATMIGLPDAAAPSAIGIGPGQFVTLTVLWHLALVVAVIGQLHLATRGRLRALFVTGYLVAIVVCVATPPDIAWLDGGRHSPLYTVVVGGVLAAHVVVTAAWIRRSGQRPDMVDAAITVALILGTGELGARVVGSTLDAPMSPWVPMLTMAIFFAPAVTEGMSFVKLGQRAHRAEHLLADMARAAVDGVAAVSSSAFPLGPDNETVQALTHALIDRQQYQMALQPIIGLDDGNAVGYEALARFRGHPNPDPDLALRRAHALGRGVELELALLRAAMRRVDEVPAPAYLSVNVGTAALLDPRLPRVLSGDLSRLVLEITEHVRIDDYARVNQVLAPLRARGLRIAIDDAGAGFASLRHVVQLHPDVLKLDRSLVARADREPSQRAVLAAMIDIANRGGMAVVGEGVERAEEAACLRTLGASGAQGFLFGRPTIAVTDSQIDLELVHDDVERVNTPVPGMT